MKPVVGSLSVGRNSSQPWSCDTSTCDVDAIAAVEALGGTPSVFSIVWSALIAAFGFVVAERGAGIVKQVLTFARGLQLPALAWMIGQTINGPIAGRNLPGIYLHAGIYLFLRTGGDPTSLAARIGEFTVRQAKEFMRERGIEVRL